jgi:hypothetical protein
MFSDIAPLSIREGIFSVLSALQGGESEEDRAAREREEKSDVRQTRVETSTGDDHFER